MSEPLTDGLARVRALLLDDDGLVRAVASGRRRGSQPPWRRVEVRYVDLKAGRHLQVTAYDDAQAHTTNHAAGDPAAAAASTTCSACRSATGTSTPRRRPPSSG